MAITLVLDQGIPRDAVGMLRELGYEGIHVGEVGMSIAEDQDILEFALGRNIVTLTPIFTRFSRCPAGPGCRSFASSR